MASPDKTQAEGAAEAAARLELINRLRTLGLDDDEGTLPRHAASELDPNAARDLSWAEFFSLNRPAAHDAEYAGRVEAWAKGGGVGRLLARLRAGPDEEVGRAALRDDALRERRRQRAEEILGT